MKYLIEFLIVFIFTYLFYLLFVILKKKNKKFNSKKVKVEEGFLILKYNIDLKKVNYRKFLLFIYLCNSIIFGITLVVIQIFDDLLIQLLFAPIVLFPLILFTYSMIGKYLKKKGFVKNV